MCYFLLVKEASNTDLTNIITPVDYKNLEKLLVESDYQRSKTRYLVNGFKEGFSL